MNRIVMSAAAVFSSGVLFAALPCRYLHEMTGEYVTEHHSFRGSLAEKPLKTLFILDRRGARDAVEVVQRFNVEPTYFLTIYGNRIAAEDMYESAWEGTTLHEKTRELDLKLNEKYDLYVFGRKAFTSVNEEHRYRILKAVRDNGAGLLMVGDTGVPKIPYGKVYENRLPVPGFARSFVSEYKRTSLSSYRLGKGIVAELAWGGDRAAQFFTLVPLFPIDDRWTAKYENAIAFAGAAMRYAAGRESEPSAPVKVRIRNRFNEIVADTATAGDHFRDEIGANGAVRVTRTVTPSPVGGMDGLILQAFFDAVRNRTTPPIDVYDCAAWMAITCLSEESIAMGGAPVAFPDFTDGKWIYEGWGAKGKWALDEVEEEQE